MLQVAGERYGWLRMGDWALTQEYLDSRQYLTNPVFDDAHLRLPVLPVVTAGVVGGVISQSIAGVIKQTWFRRPTGATAS